MIIVKGCPIPDQPKELLTCEDCKHYRALQSGHQFMYCSKLKGEYSDTVICGMGLFESKLNENKPQFQMF